MSYIGNTPFTAAFLVDTFSGNGSTVAFTMSVAPANTSSVLVSITGVVQDPSTYSVSGTTLTFSQAPPSGTSNISVRYLGIPASGVTTTAYRTQTEFTATAGQTTFTVPSYTVGYIDVYRNGLLLGSADFTATTGTTVVLANAASAGDFIETVSFYVSSVLNALPQTGGTLSGNLAIQGAETLTGAVATNGASFSGASLVAGRVDSSNEGGQVDLCRASDNASAWAIDVFGNTSTPTLRFVDNIAAAARMVIDGSGNVGVGTTSPSAILSLASSNQPTHRYTGAASGFFWGQFNSSGDASINNQANAALLFATNNAERARIDSSGNLLVGTTTAYARMTATQSDGALRTGTFQNTGASGYASDMLLLYYSGGTPNTASANFLRATDATNDKFIVATTGNVTNRNNSYGGISDVKLKENITDATPKLAQLNQVRVVNYNFVGSEEKQLGVVAQEIEAIFPALVTETPDVDNDGNDLGTTTKSVKYSVFVPMLIKALQEQQAIITQLQADVAALKGQA